MTNQQKKLKTSLQKRLTDELKSADFNGCDLESIHLFHEGNTLYIECWNKNESSNIDVTQYKILLDNKVYVDDEIKILKDKLNNANYLSEIQYLINNIWEKQFQNVYVLQRILLTI